MVPIGEFDIALAPTVDARLTELHDAGFRRLLLDLRRATFLDVCALRVTLKWTAAARADGTATFQVITGPPQVQRIFTVTGTADQVEFVSAGTAGEQQWHQRRPLPAVQRGR